MGLVNSWVGYVTRSYQQAETEIFSLMSLRVAEYTDHTKGHMLTETIDLWLGIMEQLNYYQDNNAREAFLSTQRIFANAIKVAKQTDYATRGRIPAKVDLTFTLSTGHPSALVVPAGTECQDDNGIQFITDEDLTFGAFVQELTVGATQQVLTTGQALGNSSGAVDQTFDLGEDVVHDSIVASVNAAGWSPVESLAYSLSTDETYIMRLDEAKHYNLIFGDNINGKIPPTGQAIEVDYHTSSGSLGNVPPNTIVKIITALGFPGSVVPSVNNAAKATGGVDQEDLISIQRRAPLAAKTLYRAVTDQDYVDVAILAPGVDQADYQFDCGMKADLYILPIGGGIAPGSLLASTQIWMDARIAPGRILDVQSGGEVGMIYEITINLLPNTSKVTADGAVKAALVAFHDSSNQILGGGVVIGDVYEVVEGVLGVRNSDIIKMTTIPYGRPIKHIEVLDWIVETKPASSTAVKWKIQVVDGTNFQLFKDDAFVSTEAWGVLVDLTEVSFTATYDAYTAGVEWEFYTYNYFGSVDLLEPSIPALISTNVKLNLVGGI